ncbi:hypothetical protein JDV09_08270 [Mycobacterium sp. Y57]|uniref:hypothetical protein n=1 Tax=Mycolicibacterium xanthum TaxID=2796469 RepID=UPI001C84CCB0|nr:hypothetical protein [Mycolicibacterium xanthum]MBX7432101.1 hypothetical protein [Mycolicibacterium xanthum]
MLRTALSVLLTVTALFVAGCTRDSGGAPVAADLPAAPTSTSASAPRTLPTGTTGPAPQGAGDVPGVVPTSAPPAPGELCVPTDLPPLRTVARVGDPDAPTATVAVPDGWTMLSGDGDVGARLEGPAGEEATVSITATSADPAAAFRAYADKLTDGYVITTLSVLPAEMCGFSGQKLTGILSDGTETVQYEDRIVHVGTAQGDYLIAVHVQAPSGAAGFDDAAATVTEDFEIGLP